MATQLSDSVSCSMHKQDRVDVKQKIGGGKLLEVFTFSDAYERP